MITIAIEGPCFAGKSTLVESLRRHFHNHDPVVLADYSDVDDPRPRPGVPAADQPTELSALQYYLRLDARRWHPVQATHPKPKLVLQDRCYHTLLAHTYANERISGFQVFEDARALVANKANLVEPTAVFYLEAGESILTARYSSLPNRLPAFLTTPKYLKYFRDYFDHGYVGPRHRLGFIDARQNADAVCNEVAALVQKTLA